MDQQRYCIIGTGGVFTAEDAYRKIRLGASLIQIYTALIYEGPSVVRKIAQGLARLLKRDGFASVADAVGSAHAGLSIS
jgi:dihydroorotate dehydrogenase (fumarate)/dihydroorotate dehydrogenase